VAGVPRAVITPETLMHLEPRPERVRCLGNAGTTFARYGANDLPLGYLPESRKKCWWRTMRGAGDFLKPRPGELCCISSVIMHNYQGNDTGGIHGSERENP
jgi:hypothetical protein